MLLKESDTNSLTQAIQALEAGEVISFATETVYALACDARNDLAVEKLYQLKKRETGKPIAILIKNLATAKKILALSEIEEKIVKKFMPGPLTLVAQKLDFPEIKLSKLLNNNEKLLGFRIPNHEFCLKLLEKFEAIAATSANLSSQPAALSGFEVFKYFKNQLIIDGGICQDKVASTVIKIKENEIEILREGLINKAQIEKEII